MKVGVWVWSLVAVLSTGCVSNSKHRELQTRHQELQNQLAAMAEKQNTTQATVEEQARWIQELENRFGKSKTDRAKLEATLADTRKALEESARRKAETDRRIGEYTELVRKFKSLVDAGRLSVKMVDGRMVVALSSDILFRSGSASLSADGKTAIHEVAQLLASIPDRQFQVEGHTDNDPIKTAVFPSNWELASARAVTVVKEMVDAGMPATRISAASFGESRPAKPNDSKENKAANRRIEIVIVPDLSTLPGFDELNKLSGPEAATSSSSSTVL